MTSTTSPRRVVSELLQQLGPNDVTDDEAAGLLSILQQAWNRKHGAVFHADVIELDLVRKHPRWRR